EKHNHYRPSDREPFMNERQREYFRNKLLAWREDILKEALETLQHLQDENQNHPDLADRASSETERAIELRARDRQRKLVAKIDAALQRIEDGTYGYCEETGEPIGHGFAGGRLLLGLRRPRGLGRMLRLRRGLCRWRRRRGAERTGRTRRRCRFGLGRLAASLRRLGPLRRRHRPPQRGLEPLR